MRTGIIVNVTPADRRKLEAIVASRSVPQKHVWRANIILATADGCGTSEITRRTGKSKSAVWRWQARFMTEGVAGLTRDKTRKPGKLPLPAATVQRVVDLAKQQPSGAATRWTGRMLAKATGVSLRSVQRIVEAYQLAAPRRSRAFKLSIDPAFTDMLSDVVGLYVDPPAHAIVLSLDKRSQSPGFDHSRSDLPKKPDHTGTMKRGYRPNGGITTLFAALEILSGTGIDCNTKRGRHQAFIGFLNAVEVHTPGRMVIHAIVHKDATAKHPKVREWLTGHPRWTFHFTPASTPWRNAVEVFLATLMRRRLKHGVFRSVADLRSALNRFLVETDSSPRPFVWSAIAKRGNQT
jgi:transposase